MRSMQIAALAAALMSFHASGAAQAYPAKPITWVVPYPAGGPADVIARNIAPRLSREVAQPVIIENLGGVGGALAAMKVINAPADGYTVLQGSPNEVILAPLANAAVRIKLDDLLLITPVTINPLVLLVRKDFPANTLEEFLIAAKTPGKPLSYGSVGAGSMFHLAAEDLAARIDAKTLHVPYKGGAPLLQDLGVGSIDFALLPFTANYVGLAQAGRLKILAVASPQRIASLKDIPTFEENPRTRGFQHGAWAGIMVRRATPRAAIERLHQAVAESMADPLVRDALTATGSEIHKTLSIEASEAFLRAESQRYVDLARRVGVSPQ